MNVNELTYFEDPDMSVWVWHVSAVLPGHTEGLRLVECQHLRERHRVVSTSYKTYVEKSCLVFAIYTVK